MDPIITAMIGVAVIGLICWVIVQFVPLVPPFDRIVIGVAVIMTILWLLSTFGIFHLRT